ncbi:MAG: ABC transporter ATP-binding protein [Mariniphaga sp.]|jgi:ABC-type lipoprotein export system ATPase subunit|nr:ABC transporter ATP-binding protein [Mariniphaga sp.]
MLKINKIVKKYKKNETIFTALEDVSFQVEKGEFIAVAGPSGSGKSTLLHTIGGLIRPDSGQILFNGNDVYSLKRRELDLYRKNHVGFVFQQFHLMPYLTVSQNIKMVCAERNDTQKIESYLEKCSVFSLKNKYPDELSVGEKQRVAFIRAIITKPDILLADEPTGNLDPENSRILISLIKDFNREGGTVLLVSHDPGVSESASRQIKLRAGKLQ